MTVNNKQTTDNINEISTQVTDSKIDSNNDNTTAKKKRTKKNTRRGNGEGSIFQRKSDKRWVAQIQKGTKENGKPSYKYFYGEKRQEVVDQLKDYRITMNINGAQQEYNKVVTVKDYIQKWLKTVKFYELKATAYDRLEDTINNQIIPYIGHIALSELTSMQVQGLLINKLYEEEYSLSTIKKAYQAINACCKYAVASKPQAITSNPCDIVTLPSKHNFKKIETRHFSAEEEEEFIKTALSTYSTGKPIFDMPEVYFFILETGLRMGEVLAVNWNDIIQEHSYLDDDKNEVKITEIRINKNYVMSRDRTKPESKSKVLTLQNSPKTDSSNRLVPLNQKALEYLEQIKGKRYFGEDSLIFCTKSEEPILPRNFERAYKKICERACIENAGGVHTLRHTFASKLFAKDIDVKYISELLGHSSIQVTYDTYIHIVSKSKNEALRKIAY